MIVMVTEDEDNKLAGKENKAIVARCKCQAQRELKTKTYKPETNMKTAPQTNSRPVGGGGVTRCVTNRLRSSV